MVVVSGSGLEHCSRFTSTLVGALGSRVQVLELGVEGSGLGSRVQVLERGF